MYLILLIILVIAEGQTQRDCGRPTLHGENGQMSIDELPWVVSIQREFTDGRWLHACVGSIVHHDLVLTSTKCFFFQDDFKRRAVRLVAGCRHLDNINGCQVRRVFSVHQRSGVTAIRVNKPWSYSYLVSPICLPEADTHFQGMAMIAGWGFAGPRSYEIVFQIDKLEILSHKSCYLENGNTTICAGYPVGRCIPLSAVRGEPLMVFMEDVVYLVGILESKVPQCGTRPYMKLSLYRKWIESLMEQEAITEWPLEERLESICGLEFRKPASQNRIVGGIEAPDDQFPWMVSVQVFYEPSGWFTGPGKWRHVCGGTIISRYLVLTAAHCQGTLSKGSSLRIVAGCKWIFNGPCQIRSFTLDNAMTPPDWNATTVNGDVMLIQIAEPWIYTHGVAGHAVWPICLPKAGELMFRGIGMTAGWGRTHVTSKASDVLNMVNLTIFSDCPFPRENHICAGYTDLKDDKSTCKGDSGGPLMIRKGHQVYQIGITSRSSLACTSAPSGVFMKVAYYHDWIISKRY